MSEAPQDKASREFMAECYNARVAGEWARLAIDPYRELEFDLTMHFLRKYLPPQGMILDAGGGPGRYALALCRLGYQVTLADLAPGCVEQARALAAQEPEEVRERLVECAVADICDLSRFAEGQFDATLCLGGPLIFPRRSPCVANSAWTSSN